MICAISNLALLSTIIILGGVGLWVWHRYRHEPDQAPNPDHWGDPLPKDYEAPQEPDWSKRKDDRI